MTSVEKFQKPLEISLILEIHSSLFTEELLKFKVEDLLPDGILSQDLSLLKAPDSIVNNIKAFHYNIFPETKNFFLHKKCLSGYWYLKNCKEGMMIVHQHPCTFKNPITGLLEERTSRFLTSTSSLN